MPMTERGLKRMATAWAKRLGIAGWKISISFVPQSVFRAEYGSTSDYYGDCRRYLDKKPRAVIRIVNPEEIPTGAQAIEPTVIHELLHVLLDPLGTMDNDSAFERGLNMIADALLAAKSGTMR